MNNNTAQGTNTAQLKAAVRRRMLAKRQALSTERRNFYARGLANTIDKLALFERYSRIGIYLPVRGELSLMPAISRAPDDVFFAAPRIFSLNINRLWWLPWQREEQRNRATMPLKQLPLNKYGISEPAGPVNCAVAVSSLDCLLMPLTAFDRQGNRLGMGGGYYDRSLAHLDSNKRPRLLGIGYDFQAVEQLPTMRWDVGLDAVITPDHYVDFETGSGF